MNIFNMLKNMCTFLKTRHVYLRLVFLRSLNMGSVKSRPVFSKHHI